MLLKLPNAVAETVHIRRARISGKCGIEWGTDDGNITRNCRGATEQVVRHFRGRGQSCLKGPFRLHGFEVIQMVDGYHAQFGVLCAGGAANQAIANEFKIIFR